MIGSLAPPHEVVMARMLAVLADNGFDITPTELSMFLYRAPRDVGPLIWLGSAT